MSDAESGIAVVVCSRDRPTALSRALASLAPTLTVDDEVVVVDSASSDDRTRQVAADAGFAVVRASRPGLSHARNLGVEATTRPIIAFTDDDCRVGPEWRLAIEAAFDDPLVGIATGPVVADGDGGTALSTMHRSHDVRFVTPARPGVIGHGANMAFRREVLQEAGPFDEALGAGATFRAADDWDMFWRVLRAGWTASYVADAAITHEQWRSRAEAIRTRYAYSIGAAAFCVKADRLGDPLGRTLLLERARREGVLTALRGLRQRRPLLAAIGVANLAGCASGAWRARRRDIDGDRFLPLAAE